MFLPLLLLYFSSFVSSKWLCFCTSTSCSMVILRVSRRFVQSSSSRSLLWLHFLVIRCSNLVASKDCTFIGDGGPILSALPSGGFILELDLPSRQNTQRERHTRVLLVWYLPFFIEGCPCVVSVLFNFLTSFPCNCYFVARALPLRWIADWNSGHRGQVFICVVYCLSREWGIIVICF